MVLGVDFDNTIVRYDELFHRIALKNGLIPADLPAVKNEVRDYLRRQNRENDWTELQGCVYGPRMAEAQPFPGVIEFFARCVQSGVPLYIISHKTRTAVRGPAYDLQQTAREWLFAQGFFDPSRVGLSAEHARFAETREEKIQLIREARCTHFVDDLEETFLEAGFPGSVERILFGRAEPPPGLPGVKAMRDWSEITRYVFPAAL